MGSLLQNKEYISIINNLILRTIIDDLKDQTDPIIVDWKNILFEKETLEHKKKYLLYMESSHSWPITETLKQIEADLLVLEDLLPKTDAILERGHNTADDLLLEIILANMRSTTKSFYIALQREKKT